MREFQIKRVAMNRECTHGVVIEEPNGINEAFAVSFELAWNDNKQFVSCIPKSPPMGYRCIVFRHTKRGIVFHILNVKGRTGILIHIGNNADSSEGCIIAGEKFEDVYGKIAVQDSEDAMNEWIERLRNDKEFILHILEV